MPYTSLNGHMFAYLTKEGTLALRLPKGAIDDFISKYETHMRETHGISQKEYVVVPDSLFKKTAELQKYFLQSFKYVSALKPKSTKK
jgi:hypothetical protein